MRYEKPLEGGILITQEDGYQLIYYPQGEFAGSVIGWSRTYLDTVPVNEWKVTNFGTPFQSAVSYPRLRRELLNCYDLEESKKIHDNP